MEKYTDTEVKEKFKNVIKEAFVYKNRFYIPPVFRNEFYLDDNLGSPTFETFDEVLEEALSINNNDGKEKVDELKMGVILYDFEDNEIFSFSVKF